MAQRQVPPTDRIVDVPVGTVTQVPTIRPIQKTVDDSPVQYIDQLVDVSIEMQSFVGASRTVQETLEILDCQRTDKPAGVPARRRTWFRSLKLFRKH